jgi:hypothetical protein
MLLATNAFALNCETGEGFKEVLPANSDVYVRTPTGYRRNKTLVVNGFAKVVTKNEGFMVSQKPSSRFKYQFSLVRLYIYEERSLNPQELMEQTLGYNFNCKFLGLEWVLTSDLIPLK